MVFDTFFTPLYTTADIRTSFYNFEKSINDFWFALFCFLVLLYAFVKPDQPFQ